MFSRKLVDRIPDPDMPQLVEEIAKSLDDADQVGHVMKDVPLMTAALVTDRILASLDEEARRLFRTCAVKVAAIQGIVWLNPALEEEACVEWLKAGANAEPRRRLLPE